MSTPERYGRHASSACGRRPRAASTGTRYVARRSRRSLDAIDRLVLIGAAPSAKTDVASVAPGPCLPLMAQEVRAIDWQSDRTERVLRKVRAGDGHPGVLDAIEGAHFHLFGAHPERTLRGRPGELIAQRNGAICRATVDGAVWITHLKRQDTPRQGISSCRPHTRSRSPASTSRFRRSGSRSTRRSPTTTPTARSPTTSTRAWVICGSRSTTAR